MVRYFPIEKSIYEVVPGLRPLGFDFGQGNFDQKTFQIDEGFAESRKNKIACLTEDPNKYFLTDRFEKIEERKINLFLIQRLNLEYPGLFLISLSTQDVENQNLPASPFGGQISIKCLHTDDSFIFNTAGDFISFQTQDPILSQLPIESGLAAIALQIQEDLAFCKQSNQQDFLSALHICSPSHWRPADKIGQSFFQVHAPVPGIEKINAAASHMVQAMIHKGPYVRFVWSFVTDQRLNHHPDAPSGCDSDEWRGRSFQKQNSPPFHLRVERQTTFGFPDLDLAMFTIRISFWSGYEIKKDITKRKQLQSALQSMTAESRKYKGVDHCFADLVNWLGESEE